MKVKRAQVRVQDPALLLRQEVLLKEQPDCKTTSNSQKFGIPYPHSPDRRHQNDLGPAGPDLFENSGQKWYRQKGIWESPAPLHVELVSKREPLWKLQCAEVLTLHVLSGGEQIEPGFSPIRGTDLVPSPVVDAIHGPQDVDS